MPSASVGALFPDSSGFRRCKINLSPVTPAIVEGAMTDSSFECNHEKIQAIEEAFDAAWAFIQANEPERLEARLRTNDGS